MRFLLLNTDYPAFLAEFYRADRDLRARSFDEQAAARHSTFFGLGDGYSVALREQGHWALDVHVNNEHMQRAWAREHGLREPRARRRVDIRLRRGIVPWVGLDADDTRLRAVLAAQIEELSPDVVLNHDPAWIPPDELRRMTGDRLLIAQHAASPLPSADYRSYDLVVSSWAPTIELLTGQGVRCHPLKLGFDPRVLGALGPVERDLGVTFVGSVGSLHDLRVRFFEALAEAVPDFQFWAPDVARLGRRSPLRDHYRGRAFGLDMFRVLARSRVTINHHGLPEPYANNMRLYEATGTGAMLLTDARSNLAEIFVPGEEVLTYEAADDCIRTITELTDERRTAVAAAGQHRTLAEHTWDARARELTGLVEQLL